ncbi:MAG: hypothetical protein JWR33_294 [Naasia sp.]|jgi:hypothetical protein|uniref:hypothetical protein n=1 Tax=Naasia sp. TaxID=2546198 RepID=UPI0026257B32|nr:hypothetical protein [Naasia sp.]MCU1569553.1 hypothetical protein [Naasia sp.]
MTDTLPSTAASFLPTSEKRKRQPLRALLAVLLTIGGIAASLAFASPATAASSVLGPGGFRCGYHQVQITAPRVYASRGTEQVYWLNGLERWNGSRWVEMTTYANFSSFNSFGRQATAWTGVPSSAPYGSYVNSELIVKATTPGYYRVAAYVASYSGGPVWDAYILNGAYCWVS